MANLFYILAILFLVGISTIADTFIKIAGATPKVRWSFLLMGQLLYMSTVPGWFFILRKVKLSSAAAIYSIFTVLVLACISIFWFKDSIKPLEWIGIGLAICSLLLLSRFSS